MSYKHHDLVLEWLTGIEVQYREADGEWADLPSPDIAKKMPHFYVDGEYRRKPRVLRSRVMYDRATDSQHIATSEETAFLLQERFPDGVWITEWMGTVL